MKLQVTRVLKDELARFGDTLPNWMDSFLYVINLFIDQIGRCLKGQITFADNISCKIMTVNLVHNVEYTVNPSLSGQKSASTILGVIPVIAQKSSATASLVDRAVITGFGTNLKTNGNLGIVAQFSQGGTTNANVTFIILFG